MSTAWRSFAARGDPGWPAYDPGEQLTRVFDVDSRVMRYPEQASQQIWAGYPFDPFGLQPHEPRVRVSICACRLAGVAALPSPCPRGPLLSDHRRGAGMLAETC